MPDAVETMFSYREVPWHGLGTIVEEKLTAKEALVTAGLDWDVELFPVRADLGSDAKPRYVDVPDRFAVIRDRDQKPLGVVGSDYVPFQNREAFTFFDNLVDSGEAKYETAGSLQGGQWVWLTAKVPEGVLIGGEDAIETYLLLSTGHNGMKSITVAVTPVRVVCQNTLNLALRGTKRSWAVRHTSTVEQRIQEAREAIGLTFKYMEVFEEQANELLGVKMSERQLDTMLDKLFPETPHRDRKKGRVITIFNEAANLEPVRGTRWAALNAIGEYMDWTRKPRTKESQLIGIWDGVAMRTKDKALQLLRQR